MVQIFNDIFGFIFFLEQRDDADKLYDPLSGKIISKKDSMNTIKKTLLGVVTLVLTVLLLTSLSMAQQLQILSPTDGAVINPGQTIDISILCDPSIVTVAVTPTNGLLTITPLEPPSSFRLTVPSNMPSGTYGLVAMANDGEASIIRIHVEQTDTPASININAPRILFENINDQLPLEVIALFKDGSKKDITHSISTKYTIANQNVASVTDDGILTAVGSGGTTVTATYNGLLTSVPVQVPIGDATPYYKVTATPVGTVKKDTFGNYVINVKITNNSNVPLAYVPITNATLNQAKSAVTPDALTVFDPSTSRTVTFVFPTTAGASGTTASLQLKGTYVGSLPEGKESQPGALNFSFRVRLP